MIQLKSHDHQIADNSQTSHRVPQDASMRQHLWDSVQHHIKANQLFPPISLEGLCRHADLFIGQNPKFKSYRDYITVILGNAVWMDTVASIPPERRILLLPQCMRDKSTCHAEMDEFGLLCMECGGCVTGEIQSFAEDMGTVVLVAEGTTVVTKLLERGEVDAVIGVSCLSALERSYSYMAAGAIPGIAIPLIQDGCDRTQIDVESVKSFLSMHIKNRWVGRTDLDTLKTNVQDWFSEDMLKDLLNTNGTTTEKTAVEWMAAGGKRWRPFLAASVYQALTNATADQMEALRKVAVSVECFHKASLAHDDIEDDDEFRYGQPTLQHSVGMPVALNVGDLLVGEGYRLIAECGASPDTKSRMLAVAAQGHRDLCLGQGAELSWHQNKGAISVHEVLDIFCCKTAPAFEVALTLGAIFGGGDETLCRVLKRFSEALGVAYQIRDDIEDFKEESSDNDMAALRPSLLLALALDKANGHSDAIIKSLQDSDAAQCISLIKDSTDTKALINTAKQMMENYQIAALDALESLDHIPLKSLLYRVVYKIFGRPEMESMHHGSERNMELTITNKRTLLPE